MTVYGCQFDIKWENKPENFKRIRSLLKRSRILPGSLVVLPEMFATGFTMNTGFIAETDRGTTSQFLRSLAREKRAYVLGGLARRDARKQVFNEAVCFATDGRCLARYAKSHLFTPGRESRHYTPGQDITLFLWHGFKVAVFICYDLRFPEIFRLAAQRGAQMFVVIGNWPAGRHFHWSVLLKARAVENQVYVVGVNRCGRDPQANYRGGSVVIDPKGRILASAGGKPAVVKAELDPDAPDRWRRDFPALNDIRTGIKLNPPGKIRVD